jgi:hypothetical protein
MKLSISSEFQEFLDKNMANSKPEFVYHYTDMDALLSILEKGELWLTDRNYMNDVYDEMYIKGISDKLLDLPNNSMLKSSFTMNDGVNYYPKDSYVFSASTESDAANQWLCYGNGSVCIELKRNELEKFIDEFTSEHRRNNYGFYYEDDFLSFPVFYDEKIITEIKEFFVKKYGDDTFTNMDKNNTGGFLEKYVQAYYDYHLLYGFTKQKVFSAEKEYRFLILSNRKPCFRVKNGRLIPFIKVKEDKHNKRKLPINSIMIGPKNHDKYTQNILKKLLINNGYGDVAINESGLFLR